MTLYEFLTNKINEITHGLYLANKAVKEIQELRDSLSIEEAEKEIEVNANDNYSYK